MTSRIYPVARYADARAAIRFLERGFGFTVRAVHDAPDGRVAHAELTYGTGAIGLSSTGPVDPANVWTTVRDGVYACVADPDAHCARAIAGGARVEQLLRDTDYGSREYTARDPDGHLWSFGTYAMNDADGPLTLVPELRYRDGEAAVAFLSKAFGLQPGLQVRDAAGRVGHAELWLGTSAVFVAGGSEAHDIWGENRQCTQVHVMDPDAHAARARDAGATIVSAPHDTPYGARGYAARDPEGFLWAFSTYTPEPPR